MQKIADMSPIEGMAQTEVKIPGQEELKFLPRLEKEMDTPPQKVKNVRSPQPEIIYEREPNRRAPPRAREANYENIQEKRPMTELQKAHPLLTQEIRRSLSPDELKLNSRFCSSRENWKKASREATKVQKEPTRKRPREAGDRTKRTSQGDSSPHKRRPSQRPAQGQTAGGMGGGGGNDPDGSDDPTDPEDSGDDEESSEQNETETESEMEQEVPQEELPEGLRGQKVHRIRITQKLVKPITKSRGKPRRGRGPGGGGSSPSPSPPPSRGPSRRRKRKKDKYTWVYMVQGPPGPPGQDGRDGRDGTSAPPLPAPRQSLNTTNLDTTALEQSFDRVGQNIVNVLTEQQLANVQLEQQLGQTMRVYKSKQMLCETWQTSLLKEPMTTCLQPSQYLMAQNQNSLMIG